MKKKANCLQCKKEFTFNELRSRGKYCSLSCKYLGSRKRPRVIVNCKSCNKKFEYVLYSKRKRVYCTYKCSNDYSDKVALQRLKTNYEAKVIKQDGCWGWTGSKMAYGYGKLSHHNSKLGAHRASWLVYKGEQPKGLFVLHKCHNTICSNPDHLYLGTQKQNMEDCSKAGRARGKNSKPKNEIDYGRKEDREINSKV